MNIEVDGYNICYKITGEGDKAVIVLQGWGTDLGVYDSVASAIDDKYRVIQFDFPGFGGSDEPREAWNVDSYANFFCKFVQAMRLSEVTLIGHSYGGRVIIKLASRDSIPFIIKNIILIDSAGIVPHKTIIKKCQIACYKVTKRIFELKVISVLFPEIIEDWRNRQGSSDYRTATPIMRQCLVMAVNEDLRHLLPQIEQDTLLIWGEKDTATPISDAKLMEELIPNAGLAVLKGAGHFPFLEQPQVFRNIVRAFL